MSELVPNYEFRRIGRPTRYPYDEWLDGVARIATRGIDFHCEPENFQHALWQYARNRSIKARTERIGIDQVAFQFVSINEPSDR